MLAQVDEQRLILQEIAKLEIESFTKHYMNISSSCEKKCFNPGQGSSLTPGTLSVSEEACIDRCVAKMNEATQFGSAVFQQKKEEQAANVQRGLGPGGAMTPL